MQIGAQLYTLRQWTQNEKDFAATIRKVAEIGFPGVQLSAVGPVPPSKMADICAAHNIQIVNTHMPPARVLNDTEALIAEHKRMGAKQIGIGIMPEAYRGSAEGVRRFVADFVPAAQKIKAAGLCFAYHNHQFEFEKYEGKRVIEYMLEGFAPDEMQIILDTYWVQAAGGDPADWICKLSGRVPNVHFKDMEVVNGSPRYCPVGSGNMNWAAIIAACEKAKVAWALVELDDCYGKDPFACLRESYDFLKERVG